MLTDGGTLVTDSRPTLLVLNKKDLIKPGEVAKKKEVRRDVCIVQSPFDPLEFKVANST
jgi:hypothetical protein